MGQPKNRMKLTDKEKALAKKAEAKVNAILLKYGGADRVKTRLESQAEHEEKTKGFVLKSTKNKLATIYLRIADLRTNLFFSLGNLHWYGNKAQRQYALDIHACDAYYAQDPSYPS
jgi:hypothetical protein